MAPVGLLSRIAARRLRQLDQVLHSIIITTPVRRTGAVPLNQQIGERPDDRCDMRPPPRIIADYMHTQFHFCYLVTAGSFRICTR